MLRKNSQSTSLKTYIIKIKYDNKSMEIFFLKEIKEGQLQKASSF